jgi:ribose 5-phosphate isomerase A
LSADALKDKAARAAIDFIQAETRDQLLVGIGTGSTAECFIRQLPALRSRIVATVASSVRSEFLLTEQEIPVIELNAAGPLDIYIDGADEITAELHMIKGGGAALTREKIIAAASRFFVCIADDSKLVRELGAFPLPIEVIPMARQYVADALREIGGSPVWREGVLTDNGNVILDVCDLDCSKALELETTINQITGVVTNGLFARRPADVALLGGESDVQTLSRS